MSSPRAVEYVAGSHLDVYGDPAIGPIGTVLLWHGSGPNERDVLTGLAADVAAAGIQVVVPDWDSTLPDGGRDQLLASLEFARTVAAEAGHADRLVVGGWSLGGTAAARLCLAGAVPSARAVCLAGDFDFPDPVRGVAPITMIDDAGPGTAFWLTHGTADDIVPVDSSRGFAAALRERRIPVHLTEVPTDHAGIVMTRYDEQLGRCLPSDAPAAVDAGKAAVRAFVAAVSSS